MAGSINEVKNKIVATQNMSKITKAMQMISAAKLAKSEAKLSTQEAYLQNLEAIVKKVLDSTVGADHLFFKPTSTATCTAYLVVTSDRGLAGGYNNKVLKFLQQAINQKGQQAAKVYMVGKKGFDYAKRMKLQIENEYLFVPDEMNYADIAPIITKIIADYIKGDLCKVVILYHHYVSKLTQEPMAKQILPFEPISIQANERIDYLFNPATEDMIQTLLVNYLSGLIYGIFLNGKLAEHASRMNAMQNATDNATEIIKESQLIYNRARQAAITQEINEIVGGAAALK